MRLSLSTVFALLSAPFLAYAQSNPFNIPAGGLSATGGQPFTIAWQPTTGGTVSLLLRKGPSDDLSKGTTIASKIDNDGSFVWTPPNSLPSGDDYALEIVSDANPDDTNFTPLFTISTTTPASKSTSDGASSSSATASASASSSASLTLPVVNTFTHKKTTMTGSSVSASGTASDSPATPTAEGNGAARVTAVAAGIFGIALGALAL